METLKINYSQLSQIIGHFKSMEYSDILNFSQRRRLVRLNEELAKEHKIFTGEIDKIINEHCVRDENGSLITLENGSHKIKETDIEIVNKKINDVYNVEIEVNYQPFKLPETAFDTLKCDSLTIKFIEENFLEE